MALKPSIATLARAGASVRLLVAVPSVPRDGLGLIVYPFDLNPYQEMLYGAIRAADTRFVVFYIRRRPRLGPVPFFVQVTLARIRGFHVLHFHWPQFALRWRGRPLPRLSLLNARLSLWWVRALRLSLVWTVHNVVPHEPETADDSAVTRILARIAARKIVHSAETIDQLERLGADTGRVVIIPQGSYVTSYSEAARAESRRRLALPDSARIVMFFGLIRPYKGVQDLVDAWEVSAPVASVATAPFLLVVGRCDDDAARHRLELGVNRRGRLDEGHVPDELVPAYFGAADVVALPFRRLTTSSSALLALSLGRPVLAPRIGSLHDLPEEVGFFYGEGGLTDALTRALTAPTAELDARGKAARKYAGNLSWESIGAATLGLYQHLASTTR
jgi:glycosyltransferase involved in cell wall biosynthesis